MSISHLFPEEGPTLNLNFAGSRTLDPRITFTRTSTGTYMGSNGLIKVAPADAPRFDHRYVNGEIESLGLLIEEQRTNLCPNSTSSSNWGTPFQLTKSASPNVISPDGTTNAYTWTETTDSTTHLNNGPTISIVSGDSYSISVFFKNSGGIGDRGYFIQWYKSGGQVAKVSYHIGTDSIDITSSGGAPNPTNVKVEKYPNNWYRISFVAILNETSALAIVGVTEGSNHSTSFTGNTSYSHSFWGLQYEAGTFPTSYIPTSGSTVTRNQDRVLIDGERFLDWYNPDEGTFFCNVNSPRGTVIFGVGDTFSNTIYVTGGSGGSMLSNTTGSPLSVSGLITATGNSKIAFAVKTDDSSICINGIVTATNTTNDMPIGVVRLVLGASAWSPTAFGNQVDGTISQLTYYPRRLSNDNLQNLTK